MRLHEQHMMMEAKKCTLLSSEFGWFVQLTLFCAGVGALVVKRQYYERPQRVWQVWFWDISKQGGGAVFAHILNIALSLFLSKYGNECKWYFTAFVFDNMFGILFNYLVLRFVEDYIQPTGEYAFLRSGNYGEENPWLRWYAQLWLWITIVCVNKLVIFYCILYPLKGTVYAMGSFLLTPLDAFPKVELVFVMVIVPMTLNILQFWVQDNFLMAPIDERRPSTVTGADPADSDAPAFPEHSDAIIEPSDSVAEERAPLVHRKPGDETQESQESQV